MAAWAPAIKRYVARLSAEERGELEAMIRKGKSCAARLLKARRRLVERFEWHYTPRHGSRLNLAESELGVLPSRCLDRRIPDKQTIADEPPGSPSETPITPPPIGASQSRTLASNSKASTLQYE